MRFTFLYRVLPAILLSLTLLPLGALPVYASDVTIKSRTKYYSFRARHYRDIARKMLQYGPHLGGHGRRVWAQAFRQYNWHLEYHRAKGLCRVKSAKVRMKITYTLPRLENEKRMSARYRAKWKRVYATLQRHEQAHGRNYKLLAKRLIAGLRKLKPQANCFALKRAGKKLDDLLHRQDIRRNQRFEGRERARFTRIKRRIERS